MRDTMSLLRFYPTVPTRASSPSAAPRYFFGKWNQPQYTRNAAAKLDRRDVDHIRAYALARFGTPIRRLAAALKRTAYPEMSETHLRDILYNQVWFDPAYAAARTEAGTRALAMSGHLGALLPRLPLSCAWVIICLMLCFGGADRARREREI